MSRHHVIKNAELFQCMYCNHDLSSAQWASHFELEHHYKSTVCSCGRRNIVKVMFYGSGHDGWTVNSRGASSHFETLVQKEHEKVK